MELPISLKLKKRMHKDVAYAQDILVDSLYRFFPDAIIHGGTAIWRCYKGNRFSEDVDVYIKKNEKKIEELFAELEKKGFKIVKKRIKENSLYSVLDFNGTNVALEAVFKDESKFLKEYETYGGILINVYTLTPERLVQEKVETYIKRRKIRDLYDIFFLLRYVKDKEEVIGSIKKLIAEFEKPIDGENLNAIILSPPVPSTEEMLSHIERWAR